MKTRYRNVAFLAELMINILVFSVSCAVLVGLFGQAARISRETREKTAASAQTLAVLETVKARGDCEDGAWQADGSLLCRYTEDWLPAQSEAEAAYLIRLEVADSPGAAGTLREMEAVATGAEDGRELCRLETASYQPLVAGHTEEL